MADNVTLNSGTGGAVLAADDIAGVWYVIQKVAFGALDSATLAASGAGAVSAGVQRITLASDDPAVAALQVIDNLVLAEDAPSATADPGIQVLAVRKATPANVSGLDGDYEPLQVSAGRLWASATIDAAIPAGNNNIGDVDVASIAAGDNNIGNVDVVTLPAIPAGNNNIGDVDVASIAAGDNNIGNVDIVTLPATTVAGATVKTADLDTGAGTDNVSIVGVAVGAAGGAIAITGDATNGLDVDVTRVSGTVTVDGSAVTQPVSNAGLTELAAAINASSQMDVNIAASAATLTVASHAVTNAGTFAVQVNGDALTSLQLIDNIVLAEDSVHASLDPGVQALAVRKATPANLSGADGDYEPLQVNAGRLWVDPSGVTLTVASHAVTNAGTFAVQVDGSALTSLQLLDDPVVQDGAVFTPTTTKVMMAGFEADETATASVDEGDGGAARMTLDRKQIVAQYAHAAGGASFYNLTDVQEVASQVKGSAGTIYSLYSWNLTAGPLWLKIYNALAVNVTPGTTVPDIDLMIPANADSDGAGVVIPIPVAGLAFGTAITITGSATRGTTAVDVGAAGNMGVFISYA